MRFAFLPRPIRIILAVHGIASAHLWGFGIAAEFGHPRLGLVPLLTAGAATVTIIGALIWAVAVTRDRDKELLLRSMADLSQPAGRAKNPTLPLPALRAVSRRGSA